MSFLIPFPTYNKSAADDFDSFAEKMQNLYKGMLNRVENIVDKWTNCSLLYIAHYEQFLHLPKGFQKSSAGEASVKMNII